MDNLDSKTNNEISNDQNNNTITENKNNIIMIKNENKLKKFLIKHSGTILDFVIIVLIIIMMRLYVISPFKVSGGSMLDTLYDGDIMLVEKISYRFWEPQRGDVVVIRPVHKQESYFVKRIIGIPGDKILFKNGDIYLINDEYPDGILINERYLTNTNSHKTFLPMNIDDTIYVEKDHYFLMGDNRNFSTDSRSWWYSKFSPYGTIPKENIVGRSIFVVFPYPRFIYREKYNASGSILFSEPYIF